jgi:hypothetical protein
MEATKSSEKSSANLTHTPCKNPKTEKYNTAPHQRISQNHTRGGHVTEFHVHHVTPHVTDAALQLAVSFAQFRHEQSTYREIASSCSVHSKQCVTGLILADEFITQL